MTDKPLNFQSIEERANWLIGNAEYYTAFRILNGRRQRVQAATLEGARDEAKLLLAEDGSKPFLIYAVNGVNDTYVETVKP